jgi:hypothetical protein
VKLDWLKVVRDVLLVLVLSYVVVQLTALASGGLTLSTGVAAVFLALVAGFFFAARQQREGRFAHLAACATGVWLLGSLLNSATRGIPVEYWGKLALGALITVGAAALLGGALSRAVAPAAEGERPPRGPDPSKT